MDDDGGLEFRNWAYFEPPLKNSLGLQLMSSVVDRDTKPVLSNAGGFPIDFVRDGWINHTNNNNTKILHVFPSNPNYSLNASTGHTLQMLQPHDPQPKNEVPITDEPKVRKDVPLKKRSQGPPHKSPKPKKPKKVAAPKDEVSRGKRGKKSEGLVINGIDLDLSGIPTPVCSCTGKPQKCYRWGVGGWQSACCTTSVSVYPLPMSMKRRGARIAGRKMSLGAFKKVLEKLAGEGLNLSNPIDLKPYWAKHGTNKFVTIR